MAWTLPYCYSCFIVWIVETLWTLFLLLKQSWVCTALGCDGKSLSHARLQNVLILIGHQYYSIDAAVREWKLVLGNESRTRPIFEVEGNGSRGGESQDEKERSERGKDCLSPGCGLNTNLLVLGGLWVGGVPPLKWRHLFSSCLWVRDHLAGFGTNFWDCFGFVCLGLNLWNHELGQSTVKIQFKL